MADLVASGITFLFAKSDQDKLYKRMGCYFAKIVKNILNLCDIKWVFNRMKIKIWMQSDFIDVDRPEHQ